METWRDVVGLEEYVKVSSSGRIVVKERYILNNGTYVLKEERSGKPYDNGVGYLQFRIEIDGVTYRKYVHVMVAEAFLGVPDDKNLEVNHKNGIKYDNSVGNLEWVTAKENIHHAIENGLITFPERTIKKDKCAQCGDVFEYSSSRDRVYCSNKCKSLSSRKTNRPSKEELVDMLNKYNFEEVGDIMGVSSNSVRAWCKSYSIPHHSEYYMTEDKRKRFSEEQSKRLMGKNGRKVGKFSLEGDFIESYNSIAEATRDVGVEGIKKVLRGKRRTAGGFKWEYLD